MQVFNVLDPNTNIFQSRCLEASAGTGKTFAIEHLFIRFLLESDDPQISLPEILAVTFTRDASQEMKQRIRKNLEDVQKSLEGKKSISWPYLENIADSKEALKRVKEALIYLDEMQIFTIHGFCHRMLFAYSMEANMHFTQMKPDSYSHESGMRKIVEDFLQRENTAFAHEVGVCLTKVRYDTDRLIKEILKEMQKEEEAIEKEDWEEVFSSLVDKNFEIQQFRQDFFTLAPRYKRLDPQQYAPQVELLGTALKSPGRENLFKLLQQKNWFLEKMQGKNVKANISSQESVSLFYPQLFVKLQEILLPKLKKASDAKLCLKKIAKECRKIWKMRLTISEQFSPDELLQKMQKALGKESFAQLVKEKYRVVIIDEFQDTDPIQWDIFRRLFLQNQKCSLYLVGDPKQSIYGFRNADIYTYAQAIEELGKEKKALLNTNFRSSPSLINALNAFFSKIPHWLSLPHFPDVLTYHPVNTGRQKTHFQESSLQFFLTKAEKKREKNWPPKITEETRLFPYIASEIIRLHTKEKICFDEIAILVKDRFQAKRLEEYIKKWNLQAAYQRNAHIAETKGFFAMEMLVHAFAFSSEESLKNFFLFIGFSTSAFEENPFFLKQIFSSMETNTFAIFFPQFLKQKFKEKTIYEILVQYQEKIFFLAFQQIAEILLEKSFMHPKDLLQWMKSLETVSIEENPYLQFRKEEENNKVKIMTIFASKGLEFEIVFALGIASCSLEEESNEEKEAEKMRELYVAMTRAREKLYVPFIFHEEKASSFPKGNTALDIFFSKIKGYAVPSEKEIVENFLQELPVEITWIEDVSINPLKAEKQSVKQLISAKDFSMDFPITTLSSFSSLAHAKSPIQLHELYSSQNLEEKTSHTLPMGSETGIVIHNIFECIFSDRSMPVHNIIQQQLVTSSLSEWIEVIEKMVKEIIEMPLIDSFALKDLSLGEYFQEMEFLFSEGNQFIKGFADLIFQKNEKYYLLDWKTNWLGIKDADYTVKNMEKVMIQNDYFLQAKLYAKALKRYVKLFDNRPFSTLFGGAIYVFLRGKKAYHFIPDVLD